MSKHRHHHGSNQHHIHHEHVPYWQRAHTDWRFWVGVILMLAAMVVYVLSDDLAWQPNDKSPSPAAGEVAK